MARKIDRPKTFNAGAVVTPKPLATVPVLADGQVQTVTDVRGMPLFVRKGSQLVPATSVWAQNEAILMTVDPVAGTSPPAGTVVTSQAEYTALGYDLKYPQDAIDILPPIYQKYVSVKLKAGVHLAKPNSYSPTSAAILVVHPKLAAYRGIIDPGSISLSHDLVFYGESETTLDPAQAGTVSASHTVTRSSGVWTVDQHKGKFCLFVTGVNAGTKCVIVSNTVSALLLEGDSLTSGACTFSIVEPAAQLAGSSDGINPITLGIRVNPLVGTTFGIYLKNLQIGTLSFPSGSITIRNKAVIYLKECCVRSVGASSAAVVASGAITMAGCYWYMEVSSGFGGTYADGASIISHSFVESKMTGPYGTIYVQSAGVFSTWYTTYKAIAGHAASTPLLHFAIGGSFQPQGHFNIDGGGVAIGMKVGHGSDILSNFTAQIDNCLTAYECRGALTVTSASGSGNTNGFVLGNGGQIQVANPSGLGATNEIVIDGVTHPYTDLPSAGDYIEGQNGSKIGRD